MEQDDAATVMRTGEALLAAGRAEDALRTLSAAAELNPGHPGLLCLNSRALRALGLRGPAIGALYLALSLHPHDAGLHAELGGALHDDGRSAAALPHCVEAFQRVPNGGNAATLSCVLIDLGRFPEALAVAEQGLAHEPNCLEANVNRAIALDGLGHMGAAIAAARRALAARPGSAVAQHHLAATLLSAGKLTREAWALYEGRLHLQAGRVWTDPEKRWHGDDVAGRTLLLHAEQGLGDTLQFVRYAPLAAARGAHVVLAVQPALVRLLDGTPGVAEVVAGGGTLPPFDLYCPLLSLPGVFGTTLATVPPPLPYRGISATAAPGEGLHAGLAWAGNPGFVHDRKRSVPPAALGALAGLPGVVFHNLQLEAPSLPPGLSLVDGMSGVADFVDTAGRIAGLDLVITVDTAVAHLAATMGKPVWLLARFNGCWRWLRGRRDSPWYPTLRLFRQTRPDDWDSVIMDIRQELVRVTQIKRSA